MSGSTAINSGPVAEIAARTNRLVSAAVTGTTAINPVRVADVNGGNNRLCSASDLNNIRIMAVADRLAFHISNQDKGDTAEFFNLCLALSRSIDYSIANGEVPSRSQELPMLLKQVCKRRNDCLLQAAIMVLMISVKTACEIGWFPHTDSEELKTLASEIGSPFCIGKDINTEASTLSPTISTIISRFYPQLEMGQILAFLTAKPGYEAYVMDFHILKNASTSPEDKIWFFVAQTDNLETSACITSPQQVNFLLNGKGVDRRTNIFMDNGPQLPTNVTKFLKYGTNLLQAVGQFNGNYIMIVAYMNIAATPVRPSLQDYVPPTVALRDSDSELIEGPSRISLNCPISMKRIRTPVKGHSCNHHKCFDLDNYLDMNSRRPYWRCPHCNQSVCFTDIRLDQKMVKILEEVGENVAAVMISADGSWKAVTESNDQRDKQHDKISDVIPDAILKEASGTSNGLPDVMDLTVGDDEIESVGALENEHVKSLSANIQAQLSNLVPTGTAGVNRNNPSHVEDDFWSGVYLPMHGPEAAYGREDAQGNDGLSGYAPTNYTLSPVLTDAISPALNREPESFHATALTTSVAPSQLSAPASTQLQRFGNSNMVSENGRFPSTSINVNRAPVAVQALPVQASTSVPQQRPKIVGGSSPVFSNMERQQQSRPHLNPPQGSYMTLSTLQQQIGNLGPPGQLFSPSQLAQQITTSPAPNQHPSGYRVSPVLNTDSQNLNQHQSVSQRTSHLRSPSPGLARSSSAHYPQNQTHQGGMHNRVNSPVVGQQQEQFLRAAQRVSHVARMRAQSTSTPLQTPSPVPSNVDGYRSSQGKTGGSVQPVTRPEGIVESSGAEPDWRPAGRMRGSLSGRAFDDALNQYIIRPTQPIPPARPLTSSVTSPSGIPSQLHSLMANNMNVSAAQHVNHTSTQPASNAEILNTGQGQSVAKN